MLKNNERITRNEKVRCFQNSMINCGYFNHYGLIMMLKMQLVISVLANKVREMIKSCFVTDAMPQLTKVAMEMI